MFLLLKSISLTVLISLFSVFNVSGQAITVSYGQSVNTSEDAQVYSGTPTLNFGTMNNFNVSVPSTGAIFRSLLKFPTVSLPSNAIIQSAKLRLTPLSGEGGATNSSFIVQSATSTWTESGVTYNTQPSTTSSFQVTTSSLVSGKREFEVKDIIQAYLTGGISWTGFQIRRSSETTVTGTCNYHSREASVSTNRPELLITYYVPMTITSAVVSQASSVSTLNGSISPLLSGGSGSFSYQWINSSGTQVGTSLSLTGIGSGWYGLTVTGQYGDVFNMGFLVGVRCEPVQINFVSHPSFTDDAYVFFRAGLSNYGSAVTLRSGINTWDYKTFMRFKLWGDAQNSILEGKLTLFGNAHSSTFNASNVTRVLSDWQELSLNYSNQPSTSTDISLTIPTTLTTTEDKLLDMTSYFRYWNSNFNLNYGFRIDIPSPSSSINYQDYHSSDATTVAKRPFVSLRVDDATCDRTSHTSFKSSQDGGYTITFKGKLKIQFTEEYQQPSDKKIPLKLYNSNNQLIRAINYDGSSVPGVGLLPSLPYVFGDNRAELNMTSYGLIANEMYILELTKSTGEKEYIEFIYIN